MRYGTIVGYFPDRRFGFIRPDSGQDVFFHGSALDCAETEPEIKVGQPVKYELAPREEVTPKARDAGSKQQAEDRDRPAQRSAKVVVLIDKLPGAALAEVDASKQSLRHPRARKRKPTWRR